MRSAMFSGKRRLVTGLVAASLLATMVAETGQSPAAAKATIHSGPAVPAKIQPSTVTPVVGKEFGPTCTDVTEVKLLVGAFAERTITCVGEALSDVVDIDIVRSLLRNDLLESPVDDPATEPVEPILDSNSPEVMLSLGSVPANVTAIITGSVIKITGNSAGAVSSVQVQAKQTYSYTEATTVPDATPVSFSHVGQTNIDIPVTVKVPSPPSCRTYTIGTVKNVAVDVSLLASVVGDGGCKAATGYGNLTFTISKSLNDDKSPGSQSGLVQNPDTGQFDTYKFDPHPTFETPKDNSKKASFAVTATDEYGQDSLAYDKANQPIMKDKIGSDGKPVKVNGKVVQVQDTITPIYVNVNAPRNCTKANMRSVKTGVIFNDPRNSFASEYEITNAMIRLIDCAQPGSHIAMSWFSMTDENFVNHLIQASKAGVTVRVLLNSHAVQPGSASYTAYSILKKALPGKVTNRNSRATGGIGSWVSFCKSGCLTPKAPAGLTFPEGSEAEYPALHSKFFMFSKLVNGQNAIGISSVNPTYAQAVAGFNNASIVADDNKLFNSMANYFADLAKSAQSGGKTKAKAYRALTSNSKTTTYTAYPLSGSSDDIVKMLKNVKCVYRDKGVQKRTKIYVNMFVFTRNSPAKSLWRLANETRAKGGGCEVHIIYTDMDQRIRAFNTKTNSWGFIPVPAVNKKGKKIKVASSWGVADCLSTPPTAKGKVQKLSGPGLSWDRTTRRYVQGSVCKYGSLNGKMPTINKSGGYCWINSKSKVSGGSLNVCVSTPLAITSFDPADGRAKLEAIKDSKGAKWYTHQKYIAIDGMYAGKVDQVVVSGTPNISSPGIRWNDEIITFTNNKSVFNSYKDNFQKTKLAIKKRAAPPRNSRATQTWWKP